MKKMRIIFPNDGVITLFYLCMLSTTAHSMRIEGEFSPLYEKTLDLSLLKTTLSTDAQEITVNTKILAPCRALSTLIGTGTKKIPLPNVPSYELVHLTGCLQAHYDLLHARSKEEYAKARTQFDTQLNTQERVYSTLLSAHYLGHEDLRAMCSRMCVLKQYTQHITDELPMELDVEIASAMLDTTPLYDNLPHWMAQRFWLNPSRTLHNDRGAIWSLASNTTGSQIVVGDEHGVVQVYDRNQPDPVFTFQAHNNAISTISFNSDDTKIVTCACDGSIRFLDIPLQTSTEPMAVEHQLTPFVLKTHTQTEQMAYDENNAIVLINLTTETEQTLHGHTDFILCLAFNHTGSLLASGSKDSTVKIWHTASGACTTTFSTHLNEVTSVEFSPNGSLFASGSDDKTIYLYNVASFELIASLKGHTNKIWSLIFSDDNQFLYSAAIDGSVKIWHIPSLRVIKNLVLPHRSEIYSMVLQPQGTLVTGDKNGRIVFWNIKKLISSIQALQRTMKRNTTIDQAQLIIDAYDAPRRQPLDCSAVSDPRDENGKRERGDTFETLPLAMQNMLIKHLQVKPPEKKAKIKNTSHKKKRKDRG